VCQRLCNSCLEFVLGLLLLYFSPFYKFFSCFLYLFGVLFIRGGLSRIERLGVTETFVLESQEDTSRGRI